MAVNALVSVAFFKGVGGEKKYCFVQAKILFLSILFLYCTSGQLRTNISSLPWVTHLIYMVLCSFGARLPGHVLEIINSRCSIPSCENAREWYRYFFRTVLRPNCTTKKRTEGRGRRRRRIVPDTRLFAGGVGQRREKPKDSARLGRYKGRASHISSSSVAFASSRRDWSFLPILHTT